MRPLMQMKKAMSQVNKTNRRQEKRFQEWVPIGKVLIIFASQLALATRNDSLHVNSLNLLR